MNAKNIIRRTRNLKNDNRGIAAIGMIMAAVFALVFSIIVVLQVLPEVANDTVVAAANADVISLGLDGLTELFALAFVIGTLGLVVFLAVKEGS